MAQTLFYYPPDAAPIRDAQIDDILDRILHGDAAYWRAGEATVYLGKHGGGAPNMVLLLTKFGFYVEAFFPEAVNGKLKLVAYIPDAHLGRVDVDEPWAGQNPMRIPKDFCLDREQCAEVVRHFCESGERDRRINWVNLNNTGWDTNVDD